MAVFQLHQPCVDVNSYMPCPWKKRCSAQKESVTIWFAQNCFVPAAVVDAPLLSLLWDSNWDGVPGFNMFRVGVPI